MWRTLFTALSDLILPRHWRAVRAASLDPEEVARLMHPVTLPRAPWVHALFPYRDERVRVLMQALKYYNERSVIEKLAPLAADYLLELVDHKTRFEGWVRPLIAPVPSSPKRFRERGYNQAALLARAAAARLLDAEYDEFLLTRENRTSQVHIARNKRQSNMAGVFSASHRASGRFVILIDDVVESGATLTDARRALFDEGARGVVALALAH